MHRKAQQDPSEIIWYLIYLPTTFFVFIMVSVAVSDQLKSLNDAYALDQVIFLTGVRYRLHEPDLISQRSTWSEFEYTSITQEVINKIGQSNKEIGVRLTLSGAACDKPPQFCTFSSDYYKNPSCATENTKADCAFERLRPIIQWKGSLQTTRYAVWNTEKPANGEPNNRQLTIIPVEAVFAK